MPSSVVGSWGYRRRTMSAGAQPERPVGSTLRSRLDPSRAAPSGPGDGRQRSETHRAVLEPLSPELVLVDPELAARARAALPHAGAPADVRPRRATRRYAEPRSSPARPPEVVGVGTPRRRMGKPLAFVAGLAVAGVAVGVWARGAEESSNAPAAPVTTPAMSGRGEARPPGATPNRPPPQTARNRPATRSSPRRPPADRTSAVRTFAWAGVRGANHYRVEFFRHGSKILDARTRTSRLVLPTRWRYAGRRITLSPGRYRWRVHPAFGAPSRVRYGKPVVSAELEISAEDG